MHHFATALCAGVTATVLIGGAVFTSTPVEAAERPTLKGRPERDDRCVQSGNQGEKEDQVAREPEIRERLRRKGFQTNAGRD